MTFTSWTVWLIAMYYFLGSFLSTSSILSVNSTSRKNYLRPHPLDLSLSNATIRDTVPIFWSEDLSTFPISMLSDVLSVVAPVSDLFLFLGAVARDISHLVTIVTLFCLLCSCSCWSFYRPKPSWRRHLQWQKHHPPWTSLRLPRWLVGADIFLDLASSWLVSCSNRSTFQGGF